MQSKNQYYAIARKISGSIILIGGIWLVIDAIWLYMNEMDCHELYHKLWVPHGVVKTIIHIDGSNQYNLLFLLAIMVVRSVLPMWLGCFLLKYRNPLFRFSIGNRQIEHSKKNKPFGNQAKEIDQAFIMGQASIEPGELKHYLGPDDDPQWAASEFK